MAGRADPLFKYVRGLLGALPIISQRRLVAVPPDAFFQQKQPIRNRILAAGVFAAGCATSLGKNICKAEDFPREKVVLGKVNEFEEGEIYDVKVFGGKHSCLVIKIDGKFYVTGASCSHYSAPLVKGVLARDNYEKGGGFHVTCPWHDAEFDIKTGKCVNGPTLQSIPVFHVEVVGDKVVAHLPRDMQEFTDEKLCKHDPSNKEVWAVIGGGPASMAAVETMRQNGFTGRIVFITREHLPPYDRPVLSKNLYADTEHILLRPRKFFDDADIEFRPNTTVTKLDAKGSTLHFADGTHLKYDKCLLAAGAEPRRIPIPGHEAKNIYILRRPDHSKAIQQYAKKGKQVVVVGSSFIGMEVAATLAKKGCKVSVVGMEKVPFERVLGLEVGAVFKDMLAENGMDFVAPAMTSKYVVKNGMVTAVELKDGRSLPCDGVVLGAGVAPDVNKWCEGLSHARDGSVLCDPFLKSRDVSNLWAAGDCVTFPWFRNGHDTRIEHWDVAYQQGRVAAKNMCGKYVPFANIPFFWTILFGNSLRYAGHCRGYDELFIEGDLKSKNWAVYYLKGDNIEAIATCNRDPLAVAVCELMKLNIMPSASDIKQKKIDGNGLLQRLKDANLKKFPVPPPKDIFEAHPQ